MRTSDFDFDLPEGLIAQKPAEPRGTSRLMTLTRATGEIGDRIFSDLENLLEPGDLLVVNDSRVIPARLFGNKETGGSVELLLLSREEGGWLSLARASKRVRTGMEIILADGESRVKVLEELGEGRCLLALPGEDGGGALIEKLGSMPLPSYIRRDEPLDADRQWYQTVYADRAKTGSAAAPTAGLHFTPELLERLAARGIERASVTLHVGLGTFQPVRVDDIENHRMHAERFEISAAAADAVNRAKAKGRRVVAVGTTATRVLEHAGSSGPVAPGAGETSIFLRPGSDFKIVDALITNFHLPGSTLLMLVAAFAGLENTLTAYRHAVSAGYRFYSYGDAMYIR